MFRTSLTRRCLSIRSSILAGFALLLATNLCLAQRPDQRANPSPPAENIRPSDHCPLLTDDEIRSVQHSSLKRVNTSQFPQNGYRVTQCLYLTEDVNRNGSVSITETD